MPCFREERETSVGSCTSIALFQGPRPTSRRFQHRVKAAILLPRNYKLSLVPRLSMESQWGGGGGGGAGNDSICTAYLIGHRATVISDRLVASWTSRSNPESESEITIAAIMRSGARQRKELEGRRSEPSSSMVYCSTVSPHTRVGGTK